jgi:hypothetical protein
MPSSIEGSTASLFIPLLLLIEFASHAVSVFGPKETASKRAAPHNAQ